MEIEKGIPVPDRYYHTKYPFTDMAVKDSFTCDNYQKVRSAATSYVKRKGGKMKFTVRKVDGGYRCWRTK